MTAAVDTLRAGYEAFGRGDIPTVLAIFDDTIEWYSPDELPGGGTFHGPRVAPCGWLFARCG